MVKFLDPSIAYNVHAITFTMKLTFFVEKASACYPSSCLIDSK